MKKNPYSAPDNFSISPLLELLPHEGSLARLADNADSLYARLERVRELRSALADSDQQGGAVLEEAMLQLVVKWKAEGLSGVK